MDAADIVPPAPATRFPVQGSTARFPVRRVYCIGRNYAAHAVEMGHDPDKEPPFFFQKNPDNITFGDFPYPPETSDVHFEVELVAALSGGGRDIALADTLDHVFGYAIGLDMTRRDLQAEAKKQGRPWEIGKAFEMSAPCGALVPAARIGHPQRGEISLAVNGAIRQPGDLNQMIWKLPEIIATLSRYFTLAPGDVIMTGTPAGVGAVLPGDVMEARIAGLGELRVAVTG